MIQNKRDLFSGKLDTYLVGKSKNTVTINAENYRGKAMSFRDCQSSNCGMKKIATRGVYSLLCGKRRHLFMRVNLSPCNCESYKCALK